MRASPTVSVIMPVYNAECYVASAVESILNQTFSDFEFLIVDDGSTDHSFAILERYAAQDSRIRLKSRANTGHVVALNEMLSEARGKYIARMDADDISLRGRFRAQVECLSTSEQFVAVGSAVCLIDPDGDSLTQMRHPLTHAEIDQQHLDYSVDGSRIVHPSVMMRANTVRFVGGYDQHMAPAEDLDLFLKLAELGTIQNLPEVLLQYRVHVASVGHKARPLQVMKCREAVRCAIGRRGTASSPTIHVKPDNDDLHHISESHLRWGWWAFSSGNLRSARKHAKKAIVVSPLSLAAWKLAYCTWTRSSNSPLIFSPRPVSSSHSAGRPCNDFGKTTQRAAGRVLGGDGSVGGRAAKRLLRPPQSGACGD